MKEYKFYLLSILLFFTFSSVIAVDQETSKRFYAGKILRAEVQPDNPDMPIVINNISEYEPESRITSDVGYAVITVDLDPGRSLGIYDYSLVNKQKKEFPCVAIAERENDFDRSNWEIAKPKPSRKYSMLFKVQLPPMGAPKYDLRFNLIRDKWKDLPLEFINIGQKPFTSYKDIPPQGILGIDPNKPKTVEIKPEEKKADATVDFKKTAEKKPEKEPEKKLSKAEAKRIADQAAWEKMMGTAKLDMSPKKEEEPKKEETKKEKPKKDDSKKTKKDAWDDWN